MTPAAFVAKIKEAARLLGVELLLIKPPAPGLAGAVRVRTYPDGLLMAGALIAGGIKAQAIERRGVVTVLIG